VPSYTEFTYEMKGYGGLGEGVLYSQAENVNGVEWRLKVYPRGNGKARGQWLSVFLEMSQVISIAYIGILERRKIRIQDLTAKLPEQIGHNHKIILLKIRRGLMLGLQLIPVTHLPSQRLPNRRHAHLQILPSQAQLQIAVPRPETLRGSA
jgi:hypothetical protein